MSAVKEIVKAPIKSVIDTMANRFGMERAAFESVMKKTVVPADITNEQFVAFLMVANEYGLNPVVKEIYAFPSRGGLQPIVSIDGWLKIINSHDNFNGMEFVDHMSDDGNLVSITCKMYRKDRDHPVEVTEYMSECKRTAIQLADLIINKDDQAEVGRLVCEFAKPYLERVARTQAGLE